MFSNLYKFFILKCLFFVIIGVNLISTKVYCNQKIALFGDSLMSGYGLNEEFHLSTILEESLRQKGYNVNILNASVSGDTTFGGLNRLNWLLEKIDLDIVILCLGANDMLRGIDPKLTKKNLNSILEILQEKNIKVLLAGMLSQQTFGSEYKKNFDNIYPELARKFNVSFMPFLLEGIALDPEFNLNDGKHPNASGVKIISDKLEQKLVILLKE